MTYFSTLIASIFITMSLIPIMIKLATRYQLVDLPNPRKVHAQPVPRIGGLAMALGAFVPILIWTPADQFVRAFMASTGILVLFGFIDDMKELGYRVKFTGQILAALVVVLYGGVRIQSLGALLPGAVLLPDWFSVPLALIAIVGVTNAINLADGLDGLAGGISLLGFCCIGYLAYLQGNNTVLLLCLALAGAIFGFLRFNTHPATLFMGDTGSQLLGFSAVVFAVKITQGETAFSPIVPLIILGFPVLDTLMVMAQRISAGRSPFTPDKNHFHHRLIRFGLSHAEAVFTIYVIQALLIVSVMCFKYHADWALLASYGVFSALILAAFGVADRTGFSFKRNPLTGSTIGARLKIVKYNNWIIRGSFSTLKIAIPLLLIVSCALPARIPALVSTISLGSVALIAAGVTVMKKKYLGICLRLVLYLTIPLVLYLVEDGSSSWMSHTGLLLYRFCFGLATVLVILTVKFSRRAKGFKPSTMDFLIIFIAITVPNLTGSLTQNHNLGVLAVEIIVLFFSYEVLYNELRDKFDYQAITTVLAALILVARGFGGF